MMRSLYSGVAGLKTHQTKMDVIGNNIANVNTVAYKSQSITFSELMYQTTQRASGANATTGVGGTNARQIGLGVKTGAISTAIAGQGASQTTGNPFDIMITGDAFFVVNNGSQNYFTRDGSFYIDGAGNLAMSSTGYNVMGWQVDETTGSIKQDTVTALRIMSQENMTYPAEATSKANVAGIVDKNDTDITSKTGQIMNLEIYDNLGYKYTVKMSVHAADSSKGEFYVSLDDVLDSNGVSLGADILDDISFGVDSDTLKVSASDAYALLAKSTVTPGTNPTDPSTITITNGKESSDPDYEEYIAGLEVDKVETYDATKHEALLKAYGISDPSMVNSFKISADGTLTVTEKTVTDSVMLTFNPDTGKFTSINGTADGIMTLTFGGDSTGIGRFSPIEIDFTATSLSNNNGNATISAEAGAKNTKEGAGRKLGEISDITVQKDGMIYASYDNGMSRLLGQIAVASFANASGLMKEGDNLYSSTMNSGEFDGIGSEIATGGGYFTSGVLEMSNVDLSAEFTEMITTQRGFQANSRIITVSDTLLEELTNLKR